jgi:hypothetical protein
MFEICARDTSPGMEQTADLESLTYLAQCNRTSPETGTSHDVACCF